ncbi:MAG: protein kinase [Myxococcaceae bacterium]|nr:protein kinase [Myxococcaceae bacterium]
MGSAKPSSDFDRGRLIGKYEILTRLSMGGMAELYLAFLPGPGGFKKFVAVKQILPDVKRDEAFVKMFLDEARITAAFSHANIGQVFDLGEEEGELYLAMEFISGQNLEQFVKRAKKRDTPIPIGFAARVVRDACLGLHYAHHFMDASGKPAPVVHRDVSPKNVMITYSGDVKMIDFGIAKAKGRLNRTQVGIVKGTSGYMSPEQVRNETLDGRTDLFAAAVMLHELVTSSRLFTAPSDAAMMMKIVEGEVQHPRNLNPEVPKALSDVIMKGLSRKRENRFASGKEFAKAIEQAADELWEEEQCAELMSSLFDDKIQTTRALLELANTDDTSNMTKAVEALNTADESPDGTPRPPGSKKATAGVAARAKATPMPREAVSARARSSGKLPKQSDPDLDSTMPPSRPKKPTGANRYQSQVGRDYAMYDESEAATEQAPPKTAANKRMDTPPIGNPRAKKPAPAAEPAKSGGSIMGVFVLLSIFAALGGGFWAAWAGPLKDTAIGVALHKALSEEPPPEPPKDLRELAKEQNGPKPQWLKEKEEADAKAKAEADRQKAIEDAANDPENKKILEEIDAQLKELDRQDHELRELKLAAKAQGAQGAENAKKIQELEKKLSALQASIDEKQGKLKKKQQGGDKVEIVRDNKSAKAADIGYLTLFTINPSKAAVYEGGNSLGSTPLTKVPLDEGTHFLRIVDSDSQNRSFTVTVKAGQTTEVKGIDVSSMNLMK